MTDNLRLIPPLLAGVLLGVLFFGGLWWTVRRGLSSRQPALWFLGSQLLRTTLVVAGFYAVAGSQWERLVACLAGFVTARLAVMWWCRLSDGQRLSPVREASHAP